MKLDWSDADAAAVRRRFHNVQLPSDATHLIGMFGEKRSLRHVELVLGNTDVAEPMLQFLNKPTGFGTQTPYRAVPGSGIEFLESEMELLRPYPFRFGESWFIAVRRADGVNIYCTDE